MKIQMRTRIEQGCTGLQSGVERLGLKGMCKKEEVLKCKNVVYMNMSAKMGRDDINTNNEKEVIKK